MSDRYGFQVNMAAVLLYVCSAFVVWAVLWRCSAAVSDHLLCPSSCTCLGNMVDCSRKGLISVPKDLPSWVEILELQSNGISFLEPDDFKGLHKLEKLDLSNNDITFVNGTIFQDLESLSILKITHNKLREMPVPSKPLNVTEMSLAHNMILTVSADALQQLPILESLYLNHNQIMDIPVGAFPSQSRLTRLYLNNNNIMRLEKGCLDNLTALERLKLNKNRMFELKKEVFFRLSNLKFLELSRNEIGTIHGLAFKGLQNLQVLKLKNNAISNLMDGAFWGLDRINNLQLDFNNISNVTKGWLYGLASLRQLSLTHNKIASIELDGWKYCQGLDMLDLTNNHLTTILQGTFSKLSALKNLVLDHNRVSRIDDGAFSDLRHLITLEMNDNSISWTMEDVSGAFLGLQKLMKLGLKMNHIKSITNQAFLGLQRLRQLHLEHNDITTIQENSFQPLQDLRELRLNSTNLLCDCHIGWLASWLTHFGFQGTVIAVCGYPELLRGKSIFDVAIEEFKCSEQEIPKPIILTNPESQDAFKGENISLKCVTAITGDSEPTIQWKKDNMILEESVVETVASSNGEIKHYTSSLHLHNVEDDMAGRYQCVVSNDFGSAFSLRARINVYVFPVFVKKPVDITVKAGQSAKLQCSATGQPQPVISWKKDGGDDFPAARERRMHVIPNDDQFFIVSTSNIDEGIYTCMARNEAGVIATNATVTILETPDFIRPMEEQKTTSIGETSVLECMASGSPRPKLRWLKDGEPLDVTQRHFFTADNQLLIIVETRWEDAGLYTCEMSNTLGIKRGVTRLRVITDVNAKGSGGSPSGLDDESTTTGIIIIAVVCCVVGTSLVWVIIIYQTRKRHEMYSATPTDETTLPGEVHSTGYSSDKEGSFTHGPIGITTFHYQDYQLKESGYDSSPGQYRVNGWVGVRPSAAIFPSDVEEDDVQGGPASHSQQLLHQSTSTSSLHYSQSEMSNTTSSSSSAHSSHAAVAAALDTSCGPSMQGPHLNVQHTASASTHTLSTFHPGPTNHDRCSHSITLPSVLGGTISTSFGKQKTSDYHDCDTCDRQDCEQCGKYHQQRHSVKGNCSSVDSKGQQLSTALSSSLPVRASSLSSLPSGVSASQSSEERKRGGYWCQSGSCTKHSAFAAKKQQQTLLERCSHDCCCPEMHHTCAAPCGHHTCLLGLQDCQSWKQEHRAICHGISGGGCFTPYVGVPESQHLCSPAPQLSSYRDCMDSSCTESHLKHMLGGHHPGHSHSSKMHAHQSARQHTDLPVDV